MADLLHPLPPRPAPHDLTQLAPVALAGFDRDLVCTWANPRFSDLVGRSDLTVVGVPWAELLPCLTAADARHLGAVLDGSSPGANLQVTPDAGTAHPVDRETWRLHLYPLTPGDLVEGVGLVGVDVTDDLVRLEGLRRKTDRDGLTGLLNRAAFHAVLQERAADDSGHGRVRLLVVDLNGFEQVNDTFGHAAGDAVLAAVGARVQEQLGEGDVAGRIGGDEFAVLAREVPGREGHVMVRALRQAICQPVEIGPGCVVDVSVSVGHAAVTPDESPEHVFAAADAAMYAAKRRARSRTEHTGPVVGGPWRRLRDADPVLDRACALMTVRSGCTEREALESLSRIARATHRTLLEVATDIEHQDRQARDDRTAGQHEVAEVIELRPAVGAVGCSTGVVEPF